MHLTSKANILLKLDWFESFVNKNDTAKLEYNDHGYCEFTAM